ncbi:MAG: fructosamine kinase family protein [Bacteroidota bacterium]
MEHKLSTYAGGEIAIVECIPVSGGCINRCFRLQTSSGNYFLKYNEANLYPRMFEVEACGLELLRHANAVEVPGTITYGEINNLSYLLIEWVETGQRIKNFWSDFGSKLAGLHRAASDSFGLDGDNYIGSLVQSNHQHNNWIDFFIHERLEPQIKLAADNGTIGNGMIKQFDILFLKLHKLLSNERPALLHGDLWNGNYVVNPRGEATLIDPATYYGQREMDLAMTKLFGGFDPEFYEAYNESFPLEKGFESRIDIHNLYPLMVHVNLFGGGYADQVMGILREFA